jgi:hypothetical protein
MDEKWVARIEALMRKAEDPATSEGERNNIVERVAYLMAKYGIEQDMLNAQQDKPFEASHRVFLMDMYANSLVVLLNTIASAFGCFLVDTRRTNSNRVSIFGTDDDIMRVFMLYNSLKLQMITGLAESQAHKPERMHGKTWNASFVHGFVYTVRNRIEEAAKRAKEDIKQESTGMEIVLASKQDIVLGLLRNIFPNTSTKMHYTHSRSEAAYSHGRAAGQRADLGGSRISSQHAGRRALGN